YGTVDVAMTFWAVLALALALAPPARGWYTWVPAGIAAGLAVGTKYSALIILPPVLGFVIWHTYQAIGPAAGLCRRAGVAEGLMALGSVCLLTFLLFPAASLLQLLGSWTSSGLIKPEYVTLLDTVLLAGRVAGLALIVLGLGTLRVPPIRRLAYALCHPQVVLLLLAAAAAFILTSPFVFLDAPHAAPDIFYEYRHMLLGGAALYTSGDPALALLPAPTFFPDAGFYWRWAVEQNGWLLLAASLLGLGILARRNRPAFLLTATIGGLLVFTLTHAASKADRYALLLVPFLALWAAAGCWAAAIRLPARWRAACSAVLGLAIVAGPLQGAVQLVDREFLRPDTRVLALHWLLEHAATGAIVVRENNTPDLEHASTPFTVFPTQSAFESRSLAAWQEAGVQFIVVGSLRDWYLAHPSIDPRVTTSYQALERTATLAQSFAATEAVTGPHVWIYRLP
ncbi:MAG TPA: hypothetical protein VM536_20520, partial [Chloroflexia bacterium]|nr:hypothetical protein [Chloroflexia bacterium]